MYDYGKHYLHMRTGLPTDLTESFTIHVIFSHVVLQFVFLYHLDTLTTLHKPPVGMIQLHVPVPGLGRPDLPHIGTAAVQME